MVCGKIVLKRKAREAESSGQRLPLKGGNERRWGRKEKSAEKNVKIYDAPKLSSGFLVIAWLCFLTCRSITDILLYTLKW